MHTIGPGTDDGVIAAPAAPSASPSPVSPVAPATAPEPALDAATQQGPLTDLALPQLPADTPPAQAPEFATSRREFDDNNNPALGAPHLPSGGHGAPDGSDAGSTLLGGAAEPALDAGHAALNQASGVLGGIPGAQDAIGSAHAALNQAPAALGEASEAIQQAAAPITSALPANLPALPELPADPVAALMNGTAIPGLPGIDALFQPFRDLLSSFGTGVMGALNPADLLSQSSQVIQSAMQTAMGAMQSVGSSWQGQAADTAQATGQQNQAQGQEASQRGFDISRLTDEAAAVVQRGNVLLTQVAQSFAAQASALAPVIMTPPAQATLIATATEHLGEAVTIVNATRGELGGYTGQLSAVVQQLVGANGPQAASTAQQVAESIGQPIMQQAQGLLSGADTQAAGLDGLTGTGLGGAASTHASSFGGGGAHPGALAGGGGSLAGGLGGLLSGGGSSSSGGATPAKPGLGSAMPGVRPGAIPGLPFGPGMPGTPGAGTPGSGFMGGHAPGAAGQRNSEEDRGRTVENYQGLTGNNELTGPLGESAPEVIGQTHNDEIINDYDNDQL